LQMQHGRSVPIRSCGKRLRGVVGKVGGFCFNRKLEEFAGLSGAGTRFAYLIGSETRRIGRIAKALRRSKEDCDG